MENPLIFRLLSFTERHAGPIIVAAILVTLFLGAFAVSVEIDPDIEGVIPENEKYTLLMREYGQERGLTDFLVLSVSHEEPFNLDRLQAFGESIREIESLPHIESMVNPFSLVTFESDGRRLSVLPVSPGSRPPKTEEELARLEKNLLRDPFAKRLVVSDDGQLLSALFVTKPGLNQEEFMGKFLPIVARLEDHFQVHFSGAVPTSYRARQYLQKDMPILLGLAALFILLVYYLGFRSVRAVVLPLCVIIMGTIWCLGFIKLMGFSISIVSIMTPPLVLILGSSYCIHILNQYYRGVEQSKTDRAWVASSVAQVSRTVVMASATTIVGFASLYATTLRQIKEFGLSTSVGIFSCAVLSLFFLPSVLSLLKPPGERQGRRLTSGFIFRVMRRMGRFINLRKKSILFSFVILAVAFGLTYRYVPHQADYLSYFPPNDRIVKDIKVIIDKLGGFEDINITVSAPDNEAGYFLNSDALNRIAAFEEELKGHPNIASLSSFVSYITYLNELMTGEYAVPETRGLILLLSRYFRSLAAGEENGSLLAVLANPEFSRLTTAIRIYNREKRTYVTENEMRDLVGDIELYMEEHLDPATDPVLWGFSLRFLSVSDMLTRDLWISVMISGFLIFVMTAASFRSLSYGGFALIPLVTGIMLNFTVMAVFGIPLDMTTVMVASIAIGVGVDNSIHFLVQYRRQDRCFSHDAAKAITRSLEIAGRPILLTTISVVVGLLVFTFSSFRPVIYFGIMIATTLLTTSIGSLVLLPAALAYFFRPRSRGNGRVKNPRSASPSD